MLMKMVIQFAEPHLNKIPAWTDDLAKEHEAEECMLMIRTETVDGKRVPMMCVVGIKDGKFGAMKDKDGNDVKFGIASLFSLGAKED